MTVEVSDVLLTYQNKSVLELAQLSVETRFGQLVNGNIAIAQANIADGKYSCHFGFPVMNGKHTGDGWLGLKASNQDFTIRVMDFWRREGDKLKENWVFIDMIDLLEQFGIDVFKLLKERIG